MKKRKRVFPLRFSCRAFFFSTVSWRGGSAIYFGEVALPFKELRSVFEGGAGTLFIIQKESTLRPLGTENFWAVIKVIYDVSRGKGPVRKR